jgi:hypothetical protein
MKTPLIIWLLIGCLLLAGRGWAEEPAARPAVTAEMDKLFGWMTGSFSSEKQSREHPAYFHVVLHMSPLWQERKDERWLYVEQAMASKPERPYRQRVYRLMLDANGGLISRVYTLPGDALTYAGAWEKPELLAKLKPEDLTEREGCSIVLKAESPDKFTGSTVGKSCGSDLNGASYATSKVEITASRLDSWDQGFDEAGEQVWGAREGPYLFVKQPAAKPQE